MAIHLPGDNPTPAEIIPIIEQRLAAHMKHISRTASATSGDFIEWKNIHDAYNEFLTDLRAADKNSGDNNSSAQSGQNHQPSPTQRSQEWPQTGQHWPHSGQDWPNAGQHWPDACQTRPENGQPDQPAPSPAADDQPDYEPVDRCEEEDCDEDETNLDQDEDDLDNEEVDIEAQLAGYTNDAERMAEAAADFQAHRKKRNRFDTLSAEDQAAVIAMLDKHDSRTVARILSQPPPEGLNFKISKSGLNYFCRRYKNRQADLRAQQNARAAADLVDKSADPDKAFQQALERLLRIRALVITSEPDAPLDTIDALITTLTKLRKQSLAERKQAHAEKSK